MSMGIGAKAYLAETTDNSLIYRYCSFDDNVSERKNEIFDGRIIINRCCFDQYKRISITEMFCNRLLIIENCSNCWSKSNDEFKIDMMALRILFKMFKLYSSENKIPEQVFYYC